MKYLRNFNDLEEAKAAGQEGLDSPHIDIIEGLDPVNVYQSDEPTFTCNFLANGQMFFPVTSITIENLTWAVDIPAMGGTADKDNCLYTVKGYRSNNTVEDITASATVSGSLVISGSSDINRHSAGTLTLTANFTEEGQSFSATSDVVAYQAAFVPPVTWSTYSAASEQNISFTAGAFYMSYDHTNWSAATFPAVFGIEGKEKIYIAGENNSAGTASFGTEAPVAIGGVVNGLVDCFNADTSVFNKNASILYSARFGSGLTAIVSVESGYLPATTLNAWCYQQMFENCTNLTNTPALPALTMADNCYRGIFIGCTSLTSAPTLPATTLARECYCQMFSGCTSLVNAPALPDTTLVQSCYKQMFQGCTSLATAPVLPATTLAQGCYYSMFQGCTSLVNAPTLPAMAMAQECYFQMFQGCTSLVNAPSLPATTLANKCYQKMFSACTSLVTASALPATDLADYCYREMFMHCTSLVNAPTLPATTLTNYCYTSMFYGCTSLVNAPALPATTLVQGCYNNMFYGCGFINEIHCQAIDTSVRGLDLWLYGVASTGTFYANAAAYWSTGRGGIPEGWTRINE